jgi:hypothetical protein
MPIHTATIYSTDRDLDRTAIKDRLLLLLEREGEASYA